MTHPRDTTIASAVWRRLDVPGHDACRLRPSNYGWRIEGTAIYVEGAQPVTLHYALELDAGWRSLRGEVHGWRGARAVSFSMTRLTDGEWSLNGVGVPGLRGCEDLDYSFTPATNLPQLRRIDLPEGAAAEVPAAWFDVETGSLSVLPQRYERRSLGTYWYESISARYAALLEVSGSGFCTEYPGLWTAERAG